MGKHQIQSGGRKEGRERLGTASIGVSTEKAMRGRVSILGLASLNSSGRCEGIGAIPSCLVLGPGLILGKGNIGFVCVCDKKGVWGVWSHHWLGAL